MLNRPKISSRVAVAAARSVGAAMVVLMGLFAVWQAAGPTPAAAQAACGAYAAITKQLGDRFSETPVASGLSNDGTVFQVFASAGGSTFTVLITRPDGMSCLVAAGESLQLSKVAVRGRDS